MDLQDGLYETSSGGEAGVTEYNLTFPIRKPSSFKKSRRENEKLYVKKTASETSFASLDYDMENDSNSVEGQFLALQEQLVAAIIDNQNLADEVRKLRGNGSTEALLLMLEKEKAKNQLLSEKLSNYSEDSSLVVREKSLPPEEKSPRSHSRGRFGWRRKGMEKCKSLDQSEFLAASASDETKQSDSNQRKNSASCLLLNEKQNSENEDLTFIERLKGKLHSFFHEILRDFSEVDEEEQVEQESEGDPLTVKKLKDNVLRFTTILKPFNDLSSSSKYILKWNCPPATFLLFLIYMSAVAYGYIVTICLLCIIWSLTKNYFINKGWTMKVFRKKKREISEASDNNNEHGIGDKFAVVLHVARRVQNILGAVSDGSEKIKNLLLWEHESTRSLYFFLWLLLASSLWLSPSQMFKILGAYLGMKLFIVDFLFSRFPRIRLKYDSSTKLWDTLPTNADLEKRNDKNGTSPIYTDIKSFFDLFNLPSTEIPLPGWHSGKRCTLVNRDKSITGAFKNGRLYLTNNFLCFERSKSHPNKNITVPLCDVITLEKANSYPWIPGGGMAIEVYVANSKVYFFGGIMNRDEVFDAILHGCKRNGITVKRNRDTEENKEKDNKEKENKEERMMKYREDYQDDTNKASTSATLSNEVEQILDCID